MTSRGGRCAIFIASTILSLPGAAIGFGSLWSLGPVFLLANEIAWLVYLVMGLAWIVDHRLPRGWPVVGTLAALSFGLVWVGMMAIDGALFAGGFMLAMGLVLVLPATLLAVRLAFFHLVRP